MKSNYITLIALCAITYSQLGLAMEATPSIDFMSDATIRNMYGTLCIIQQANPDQANMTYAALAKKTPNVLINLAIATNNVDHISLGYTALPKTERFNLIQAIATADISELTRETLIKASIQIDAPDQTLLLSGIRTNAADNLQFLIESSSYLTNLEEYAACFSNITQENLQQAQNALTTITNEQDPSYVDGWICDFAENNPTALVYLSALTQNPMYVQLGQQQNSDNIITALKSANIPSGVSQWLLGELEEELEDDIDHSSTQAEDQFALTYFASQFNQ